VAFSSAQQLRHRAIDIRANNNTVHWFPSPTKDPRLSLYLEAAATEFQVQSLRPEILREDLRPPNGHGPGTVIAVNVGCWAAIAFRCVSLSRRDHTQAPHCTPTQLTASASSPSTRGNRLNGGARRRVQAWHVSCGEDGPFDGATDPGRLVMPISSVAVGLAQETDRARVFRGVSNEWQHHGRRCRRVHRQDVASDSCLASGVATTGFKRH
jgi:hypothetical protein